MASQRISRVFGAVNIGSFRISAIVAGLSDNGEMVVLGSGHRASQGIKRGYVTDMRAATYAVRDAVERAEKMANTSVSRVWIGCSGAGLVSQIAKVDIDANQQIAMQFGIRSIPTVMLFDKGQIVDTFVGVRPKSDYDAALKKVL